MGSKNENRDRRSQAQHHRRQNPPTETLSGRRKGLGGAGPPKGKLRSRARSLFVPLILVHHVLR